jgi:hypothetical protein
VLDQLRAAGAIRPGPGPARSWLERELSRPDYRRSIGERVLSWLGDHWARLQAVALDATPLSTGAAALLLVALVVLAVTVAARVRREALRPEGPVEQLSTPLVTAGEHRSTAEAALATGDFGRAVVEAFRALAARSAERGVLDEQPGRTAHELATALVPVFPARAADLEAAAALFDQAFYGSRSVGPRWQGDGGTVDGADARAVLDLDDALRSARAALPAVDHHDSAATVPR